MLKVTAKRDDKASYSIGKGIYSSVGVLMVGGEETSPITKQTFIYLPYGVEFNANGGRGTMESQRFFYDAAPVSLRQNTFVRDGYIFVGWNTMADGSGTAYADGAKVQNLTDEAGGKVTLFAQWIQNLPYIDEKGKEQVMQFGEYSLLTSLTDVNNLPSGWYVVFDNVEYSSAMKSTGNLNIILADGAKLACGIEAKNLAIYGQEKQTGRLTIYGSSIEESFSVNGGSLIFGWTSTDNRISADKYFHNKGSIKFADDQAFMDEQGNIYSAKLINWRISDIAGKTLVPYLDESYVAQDGAVLTGSLTGGSSLSYKISIADGATVTFDNVTINGVSDKYFKMAGITCLGNCMIILKGKNSVMGFWEDYPGIYVPVGKTLTIEGGKNDTLYASSNGWAPGIGGGFGISCGNIKIMGGNVFATGGKNSAGIGLGEVRDGVVTSCGNITIASGVTKVMATGGEGAPYSIGIGKMTGSGKSSVGTITIDDKETGNVSVNPYVYYPYTIVFDKNGGAGVMANLTINFDDEKTLQQNRFNRDDYFFVGWNTKANGKGDSYLDGAKVKNLTDAGGTITLYAQWQKFNGDLSVLVNDGSYVAEDGYVLRGALASNSKILIADGASVTLKNVTIEGFSDKNNKYEWAGITCLGDCKIILEGSNKVKGFWEDYPGIHVLEGKTLTIEGGKNDTLYASSNGWAPGLGGGFGISCGNIKIMGGNVFATGGKNSAGIGLGEVRDGVVTSCGDITIASEVTKVMATGGEDAPYSIGLGKMTGSGQSSVGTITIGGEETGNISISPYVYHPYTIVFNKNGGTGVMANQILSIDFEKSLKRNAFSRDGYNFIGWNTMADGKGDSYLDGAKVKNLTDAGGSITLYAQWRDGNVMDLSTLANDYIVRNGGLLFGTLDGQKQPYKISIADGATVTLKNVTIEGYSDFNDKNNKYEWAGITCLGDCKIILEGLNNVKGFWEDYPGIHVPEGKTLTIEGGENDTLYVSSNGWASGIGGGFGIGCGNIKIMSGVVFATGGKNAAGIGLGEVRDGVVTSCGDITIASEVTKVIAKKGAGAPYSIGIGKMTGSGQSSVGIITIGGEESGNVSTSPFIFPAIPYTVVFNKNGGEGSMDDQTLYIGNKFALNRNTFTCEGYVFAGWNTDPNGNGVAYEDGAVVMDMTNQANATVTLYAQWLECGHITNLEKLKYDYVARDGDVLIGKYDGYYHYQISIDDGATVTLYGVNFSSDHWDGLTCLGNCKIILKGENIVNGRYSGIYVPVNRTLTIEGDGLLEARGIEYLAVGLGCGHGDQCGNIEINSGVVIATGGDFGVGIGCAGFECSIGDITINGGAVTAIGGRNAAGIGCVDYECSFGDITITDSVQKVTVMSRGRAVYSIGGDDYDSHYGTITIGGEKTGPIGDNPFIFQTYGMVFDANGGSGTMEKQRFVYNANPTALSKNTFTRDGLVFAGWNTKADGSGTAYADEAKVQNLTDEAGGKVTLYAQWAVPYIDENGAEQIKQLGEYTVLTGKMDMSNLSSGWYVVADEVKCYTRMKSIGDLNIILADGANFACGVDVENITIYGQNQQTGTFISYGINVKQNFTINGGNVVHGWTNADDLISINAYNYLRGGVKIADGQVFKDEHDNIYSGELTAVQFSVIAGNVLYPSYFVVTFDAQNGSDAISVSTVSDDKNDAHVLAPDEPTREGYKFMGWFTTADGDAKFDFSAPVTRNTTVYAQWNKITNTFAAITISKDKDEKVHATIDGSYSGTAAVSLDDEIDVADVVLDRTLSTIGYATITLPFDIDSAKVKGAKQFLKFVGVILNEETKLREVHFERAWCDLPALLEDIDNLKDLSDEEKKEKKEKVSAKCNAAPKKLFAYTPYVVQMKDESLSFEDGVTLVKTPDAAETVVNNWVFRGTLAPKTWEEGDPEIGNAYGYVAGTGEFRKVGDNSSIGALRSYLVYEKRSSANIPAGASTIRANFSTEFLQANMDVVIVDDDENGKEHRTVIGKFNTRTGEFKFTLPENGTFDVKGRCVNETRSVGKGRKAKGVYYGKRGGRD